MTLISIMPPTLLLGVILFSVAMAFTPGPNNIMLATSGANFGMRASAPHILGVTLGFPFMLGLVGLGLASLFTAVPAINTALKIVSVAYLLWLAWKIARSGAVKTERGGRPLSFAQAAAFQWINPKGWMMAVGAVTTYTSGEGGALRWQVLLIAAITLVVSLASSTSWTLFGQMIGSFLKDARHRLAFNLTMAGLLVLSIAPVLFEG